MKTTRVAAAALVCALVVAGCGKDDDSSKASSTTAATAEAPKGDIVLGLLDEQSGPTAAVQAPAGEGARKAVDAINAKGGVDGRKIKLVTKDTAGDPATTIRAIQELKDAGVVAIAGPVNGGVCSAIGPAVEKAELPTICFTPADLPKDHAMLFGVGVDLALEDEFIFERLGAENGKVGVLAPKTAVLDLIKAHIANKPPKDVTVQIEEVERTDTSAKAQMQKLKADGVGGILIAPCGPLAVTAAKEAVELGYTGKIIMYNCFASAGAAQAIKGFANGNIETLAPNFILGSTPKDDPQYDAVKAYEAAGGSPDIVEAAGWDGVQVMVGAIAKAKSDDPAKIVATLEDNYEYAGVWSAGTITKDDHRGAIIDGALIPVVFTTDGKMVPVDDK